MKNDLFNKLMAFSQLVMATSFIGFIGFIVCLLISYLWDDHFSINLQILAHILTIAFAGLFKIAVVVFMAAKKEQSIQNLALNTEVLCCSRKF